MRDLKFIASLDACPCESGFPPRHCCIRHGRLRPPKQCRTVPPRPKTGFSHPNCYAAPLRDCSREESREHFISEAALKHLDLEDSNKLLISGVPWSPNEQKQVSPNALSTHVLCKRHNEALSPLDTLAGRFFGAIMTGTHRQCMETNRDMWLFNGHDLERWMLKAFLGAASSGNNMKEDGRKLKAGNDPPVHWLRSLFYERPMEVGCGLYLLDGPREIEHRINHALLTNDVTGVDELHGNILVFNSLPLCLSMLPHLPPRPPLLKAAVYRPTHLAFQTDGIERTLIIEWNRPGDGVGATFKVTPMESASA